MGQSCLADQSLNFRFNVGETKVQVRLHNMYFTSQRRFDGRHPSPSDNFTVGKLYWKYTDCLLVAQNLLVAILPLKSSSSPLNCLPGTLSPPFETGAVKKLDLFGFKTYSFRNEWEVHFLTGVLAEKPVAGFVGTLFILLGFGRFRFPFLTRLPRVTYALHPGRIINTPINRVAMEGSIR